MDRGSLSSRFNPTSPQLRKGRTGEDSTDHLSDHQRGCLSNRNGSIQCETGHPATQDVQEIIHPISPSSPHPPVRISTCTTVLHSSNWIFPKAKGRRSFPGPRPDVSRGGLYRALHRLSAPNEMIGAVGPFKPSWLRTCARRRDADSWLIITKRVFASEADRLLVLLSNTRELCTTDGWDIQQPVQHLTAMINSFPSSPLVLAYLGPYRPVLSSLLRSMDSRPGPNPLRG